VENELLFEHVLNHARQDERVDGEVDVVPLEVFSVDVKTTRKRSARQLKGARVQDESMLSASDSPQSIVGDAHLNTLSTATSEELNGNFIEMTKHTLDTVTLVMKAIGGVRQVTRVEADCDPPVSLEGSSMVYVLHIQRENTPSTFYVGETESIRQRLKEHRYNTIHDCLH
jgi:hypothetical protein